MKNFFGWLMIVLGIAIGGYIGIYVMFIGGIVDVVLAIRAYKLSTYALAVGITKILFAGVCGGVAAAAFMIFGRAVIRMK